MAYALKGELNFCDCGDRLVFIDVATGRYFCLPQNWELDFRSLWLTAIPDERAVFHLDYLIDAGVLERVEVDARIEPTKVPRPSAQIFPDPRRASLMICARSIAAQLSSIVVLRTRSFGSVVATLSRWKKSVETWCEPVAVEEIADGFSRSALLFSPADRCLPRSIAFFTLCLRRKIPATLVLGVRVNPFTAHCWVQNDMHVLNDSVENIRLFTPILAV